MKIIISPAKRMKNDTDGMPILGMPSFPEKTGRLLEYLKELSLDELKTLLKCNDSIAEENFRRYREMDGLALRTPAIFAYQGIQYQYMAPTAFTRREYDYIQAHLRILSGFYGMLRPFDGIYPYRLEMQAKPAFCANLYEFWGEESGRADSGRRAPSARWPGAPWCGGWRKMGSRIRRTSGVLICSATIWTPAVPEKMNLFFVKGKRVWKKTSRS